MKRYLLIIVFLMSIITSTFSYSTLDIIDIHVVNPKTTYSYCETINISFKSKIKINDFKYTYIGYEMIEVSDWKKTENNEYVLNMKMHLNKPDDFGNHYIYVNKINNQNINKVYMYLQDVK